MCRKAATKGPWSEITGHAPSERVREVIHCGPAKTEKAMTGRTKMGAEVRLKSMCDKINKRAGWRDRNFCSEMGEAVSNILNMDQF